MNTRNRLVNASNKYQTNAKRVLCLCSAGLLRSPTTANLLHQEFGYNTRAAGVHAEFALVPVDEVLLAWADEIVCVEQSVAQQLAHNFDVSKRHVVVLDIPDNYEWNDPHLRACIKQQYVEITGGAAE